MKQHQSEVEHGERFKFGDNWMNFLKVVNEERITVAEQSLQQMLGVNCLKGKSFLDAGSGSGLFSLVARRLGAKVHSFDYDPQSVACTAELKERYFPNDEKWIIEEESVLNVDYLARLGTFDIVYSWGVLHHTGEMWQALENVTPMVAKGGRLFIAIYNDQGFLSRFWLNVKKIFNKSNFGRIVIKLKFYPYFTVRAILAGLAVAKCHNPFAKFNTYQNKRGMSIIHDWDDWLGGYPFETAKPEEIFEFYRDHGFSLQQLKTCAGGHGCNEFVFTKKYK